MGILRKGRRRMRWGEALGMDRSGLSCWRRTGLSALTVLGLCVYLAVRDDASSLHASVQRSANSYAAEKGASSRHLMSEEDNSTNHGPVWERCDFELNHIPGAWIFSHTMCILVIFIALAIVCDDFFVPSLEAISEKLDLSEDVAGATFMAAGSSAPELFTSVVGVAVETDVGVGTIVGSAVFNILIIIALTAALAGKVLHLDWRPLIRDSFFYAMSIACFIGFSWDGYFVHYEAAILLLLYVLYIILMAFNPRLMDWMGTWRCCCVTTVLPVDEENQPTSPDSPDHAATETNVNSSQAKLKEAPSANGAKPYHGALNHARRVSLISQKSNEEKHIFHHHQRGSIVGALGYHPHVAKKSLTPEEPIQEDITNKGDPDRPTGTEEEEEDDEDTMQICPCLPCCPPIRTSPPSSKEAREEGGIVNWLKLILRWVIFFPAFPFFIAFSWTIPDCSKEHNKKWFLVSFLMSVVWIAALSFGMVTLVSRTGCILRIDTYTMGLVIVAMGTSIPDAMSSVLVARDGYGDMAVSNAIGSNVFDINLGLGLPFIIRIAIDTGKPIALLSAPEWVAYHTGHMAIIPHAKFGFILLVILIFTLIVFGLVRFRLNKAIGISFVFMYIMFLAYAFIQELYCVRTLDIYC